MNRINQMIDVDRWCIDFCEREGFPHLSSVKSLGIDMAIRDAIRYRGVRSVSLTESISNANTRNKKMHT